jgi:hypothetical protein
VTTPLTPCHVLNVDFLYRDDPTLDENTRLKNRIAELESLVRELRGKRHRSNSPTFTLTSGEKGNLILGGLNPTFATAIPTRNGIRELQKVERLSSGERTRQRVPKPYPTRTTEMVWYLSWPPSNQRHSRTSLIQIYTASHLPPLRRFAIKYMMPTSDLRLVVVRTKTNSARLMTVGHHHREAARSIHLRPRPPYTTVTRVILLDHPFRTQRGVTEAIPSIDVTTTRRTLTSTLRMLRPGNRFAPVAPVWRPATFSFL